MQHVRWSSRPTLRAPVLIAGFTGWNDAGDAASTALRHLADGWQARSFAEIDPEEFCDFHVTRPHVRLVDGETREIVWPATELLATGTAGSDVVLVLGPEPQLKWRTYCSELVEVAKQLEVRLVITLGALLADVPHRRAVSIIGTASDPELIRRLELHRSRYEGPTGILGCLHDACSRAGLPSLSFWAAVPAYAPATASPKAALALARRAANLVGAPTDGRDLEAQVGDYEAEVDDYVARDEDLQSYVERLEAMADDPDDKLADDDVDPAGSAHPSSDPASGERLVAEVEQFLRDHGTEG